jgi:hypothetical protein
MAAISPQQSAGSKTHLPQNARMTPGKQGIWISHPFAIFASFAIKLLWLILMAECSVLFATLSACEP